MKVTTTTREREEKIFKATIGNNFDGQQQKQAREMTSRP